MLKNHFEILDDGVKVYANGKNKDLVFFIDKEDLELISPHSWRIEIINKGRYLRVTSSQFIRGQGSVVFSLSRLLMGNPTGKFVDHIDKNPLNNRRLNLRITNPVGNSQNASKHTKRKTSSIYKGVSWHKLKMKWISSVFCNGKHYHLGYFNNELDAAKAYDQKAKELHQDFASLNFKTLEKE